MPMICKKLSAFLVIFYSVLSAQPVAAATITNGDFENGLNDYAATSTEFAKIASSGANNFLALEARAFSGQSSVLVSQQVEIDAEYAFLTFDAGVLSEAQTGFTNPSSIPDLLQVAIGTFDSGFTTIFQIDSTATTTDFLTDLSQRPVVTAGDTAIFDSPVSAFSVTANLSDFAGQTLDLAFGALNFDAVEKTTFFGIDNIAFASAAAPVTPGPLPVTPVPLPAAAWMLFAGCCVLLRFRRRGSDRLLKS